MQINIELIVNTRYILYLHDCPTGSSDHFFFFSFEMKEACQDMQPMKKTQVLRLQCINHSKVVKDWHTPKLERQ